MDIKAPGTEVSQELVQEIARELLISISQTVPDKLLNSSYACENFDRAEGIAVANGDGVEVYRSELISISYTQPPENKVFPVSLGNHEG